MEDSNFDIRSIKLENFASKSPMVKSKVHLTKIGDKGEVEMVEGFNHTNHGVSFLKQTFSEPISNYFSQGFQTHTNAGKLNGEKSNVANTTLTNYYEKFCDDEEANQKLAIQNLKEFNTQLKLKLGNQESSGGLSHYQKSSNLKSDRDNFHRTRMMQQQASANTEGNAQTGLLAT
jgi:hypothetical protein